MLTGDVRTGCWPAPLALVPMPLLLEEDDRAVFLAFEAEDDRTGERVLLPVTATAAAGCPLAPPAAAAPVMVSPSRESSASTPTALLALAFDASDEDGGSSVAEEESGKRTVAAPGASSCVCCCVWWAMAVTIIPTN